MDPVIGEWCIARHSGTWRIFTRHEKFRGGENLITSQDCRVTDAASGSKHPPITTRARATELVKQWDKHISDSQTKKKK